MDGKLYSPRAMKRRKPKARSRKQRNTPNANQDLLCAQARFLSDFEKQRCAREQQREEQQRARITMAIHDVGILVVLSPYLSRNDARALACVFGTLPMPIAAFSGALYHRAKTLYTRCGSVREAWCRWFALPPSRHYTPKPPRIKERRARTHKWSNNSGR